MSFKREGDDSSQLNVLKKRRVADLLASYIPEDEALLCKNGRYACTVCPHRPVFDTMDMLTVHRNGKKHIASLQRFYGKKTEHKNEIQKRQHQEFVRAEEAGEQSTASAAPLLSQTRRITQNALLKAAPYNSCCSRNRSGPTSTRVRSSAPGQPPAPSSSLPLHRDPAHPTPESPPDPSLSGHIESSSDVTKQMTSKNKKLKSQKKGEENTMGPEKERALKHYLLLKSSGWIPDGSGKWVKDENVEFDSDEEEPPALEPPDSN
ncbi:sodium channel modifier 1-like [Discoglossus pictus]